MKILMLAQFYTPVVGGEEHAVRSLSVELASRGHEVGVATIVQGDSPAVGLDDDGVRVHRLRSASSRLPVLYGADRRHAPPVPDPELLWRLRRLIRSERPTSCMRAQLDRAFLPAPPQDERAPLVLSLHDYSLICSTKRLMRYGRRCDGPALRKCIDCASHHYGRAKGTFTVGAVFAMQRPEASLVDLFLPVSNAVAEASRLEQEGLRYRVIPNFVPPGATAAAALDGDHGDVPGLPRLPDGDFVLYIGDLSLDKGVDVLLRALRHLPRPVPLVVIGRSVDDPHRRPPSRGQARGAPARGRPSGREALRPPRGALGVAEAAGLVALEGMTLGKPSSRRASEGCWTSSPTSTPDSWWSRATSSS